MADFRIKNDRLDSWNEEKKLIENRLNINFNADKTIKYRIKPYSMWWLDIGENIGTETSGHIYTNPNQISFKRPCIVVSTNNFNNTSFNSKVIIMPLTSKKPTSKVRHFHYELKASNYKGFKDKKNIEYEGLHKDSLVICNDIKTIDTRRLTQAIYPKLKDNDINNIKIFIKKYFNI